MLSVEKVYETFLSHDVDFFTGVPEGTKDAGLRGSAD